MSIIDSSPKPKTITLNNGASISTSKSRFGRGSLVLNGSNQYASIPDNTDFGFGTGDFTIEMWVYPVDRNNWRTLIALGTHTNGLLWRIGTSGDQLYFNGTYWDWGASSVPLSSWSHLALVRSSGTIKVFINGNQSFSNNSGAAGSDLGSSRAVNIGAYNPGSETFNGYLDEIRITKGIGSARYSSNFDIKTLLAPFPSSGTSITSPGTPTNLNAIGDNQRIDLTWTAPAEDNGGIVQDYSIQHSTDSATWIDFTHTPSSATSISVTGLVNGTSYSMKVAAINVAGTGDYTVINNAIPIVPPEITISSQPKNNFSDNYNDQASFSISANITNGASLSYQWQYYGVDWETYNMMWISLSGQTSSTLSISPASIYSWNAPIPIRCFLSGTQNAPSILSNTANWIDMNSVLYLNGYSYGQNGSYPNSSTQIDGKYYDTYNTMQNGESINVSYYNDNWNSFDTSWYTGNAATVKQQISNDGTNWTDVNSTNFRGFSNVYNNMTINPGSGTKYYRFILVTNWPFSTTNGSSSASRTPSTRFIYGIKVVWPITSPAAPTNVVADPGDTLAIVSWSVPTENGGATIANYTVQYSSNGGTSWNTFGTSASTSLTVTGLNNGASNNYIFRVSATNSAGTGPYSSSSSSISPDASYATIPGAPTNITGIAGNSKVLLNWVAPTDIGKSSLTDYALQYSADDGATWNNYVELTTGSGQNFSGTSSVTAGFFRVLNRGGNWDEFFANWQYWKVVGNPTWTITNVTQDPNDTDTITVTISGGTFESGSSYQFTGPVAIPAGQSVP